MNKKSFVLYTKIDEVLQALTDAQKGMLFQAIVDYEKTGEEPTIEDPTVKVAFIPIRQELDVNNEKWEKTSEARSKAGKKGAEAKYAKQNLANDSKAIAKDGKAKNEEANLADNDNDNDNDKKEKEKYKKEKAVKHVYGEYKHVKLTDDEYARLVEEYGENAVLEGIKNVDEYCQAKGKTYKDYNLVMRNWGIKSPKLEPSSKPPDTEDKYADYESVTFT